MADEIIYDDELLAAAENDMDSTVGEDFDPDAEYNQPMPPVPDGWYYATLRNVGRKVGDSTKEFEGPRTWGTIPSTYYTIVEASIIDPSGPQNNKTATGNVTTHNEKTQDGTSRGSSANMYYKAIAGEGLPGVSQGVHIAKLASALRGKPEVWIKTRLEGQDQDAAKAFKERKKAGTLKDGEKAPQSYKGQKHFFDEKGKLTGVKVEDDGTRIVGRPVIVEVKPASFVPPVKR